MATFKQKNKNIRDKKGIEKWKTVTLVIVSSIKLQTFF